MLSVLILHLDKRYIVNHSLKMVACSLLIEITKFCREPPPRFLPTALPHPSSIRRSKLLPITGNARPQTSVSYRLIQTQIPPPTPSYVHARKPTGKS